MKSDVDNSRKCGIIEIQKANKLGVTMKQINARISDEMHRAIKSRAAKEGKTMTEVIVTLLQEWLEEDDARFFMQRVKENKPGDYYLEERKSVDRRCVDYCLVNKWCNYYRENYEENK